jgi:hypothetical protein
LTAPPARPELPARPQLNPALRSVWRDEHTVQLGIDAERALVIEGLDARRSAFVASLNGSRTRDETLTAAGRLGLSRANAEQLLRLLASSGALLDAAVKQSSLAERSATERERIGPDLAAWTLRSGSRQQALDTLARRETAAVTILGAGRVGATAAGILAAAGVGHLRVVDPRPMSAAAVAPGGVRAPDPARTEPTSPSPPKQDTPGIASRTPSASSSSVLDRVPVTRGSAAFEAARSTASRLRPFDPVVRAADLVLVCPDVPHVDYELRGRLLADGIPHLLAAAHETVGVVGPMVVPGRSPCLQCLDLHRVDRDPGWPVVAAQFTASGRQFDGTCAVEACDIALGSAVAAQACLAALAYLDDPDAPNVPLTGAAVELRLGDDLWCRRAWSVHPRCGCSWAGLAETMAG